VPLSRTVLSVAIAALVAAWLPFSVLYVDAVTKHATVVIAKAGHAVVTTRSSGGQTGVSTGSTAPARAPAPVTTRAS
jgi:hypothetical protein